MQKMSGKLSFSNSEEDGSHSYKLLPDKSILPRKKLLVLSLGGLLCHRVWKRNFSTIPKNRNPDAAYGSILVYKRPYSKEFLKFCFERFEVGIWSSAREWYMNNALDCVMGDGLRNRLLFSWDQNRCTISGFCTLEKKEKPIFFKELNKIWAMSSNFSASNTLLIDDEPYKALLNPPHTALFLAEYKADSVDENGLGPGSELRLYLDGLAKAENVPAYVKEHPFGQPAITATHPDWGYYSMIKREFSWKQGINS